MSYQVQNQAVIAIYQKGDEWACILVAERKSNGTRILHPFVVAGEHGDTFSACPMLYEFAAAGQIKLLRTRQLEPHQRKALMNNSVAFIVKYISQCAELLEVADSEGRRWPAKKCAKLGMLRRIAENSVRGDTLPNFQLASGSEAFKWLLGEGNDAFSTVCAVRIMAVKHKLDVLTHAERESKAMNKILGR